jgi:UDP-glucose 4-epimerase
MRKILVTGGAGNIGGALAKELVKNPDNYVVIADSLITGNIKKLPPATSSNWKFIKCNTNHYADISAVILAHQFDYIFHYAALVGVQRTLDNPVMVLDDIQGIKNILDLAKNTGVKRVFYSSSSEVYGEPVEFPQNEHTTPLNSRLPYAIVKNVGEAFLKSYQKEYGLDYTIFRFFNTYGPDQSTDFVMAKFIKAALRQENITIYGEGKQSRTFCYVTDNIEATTRIFYENLHLNDTINIGNDEEMTILSLAEKIIEMTGSNSKIIHLPALKEGDMTRRKPDNTKMRAILGRPLISAEEGIQKMIDSLK